jgi:SSS family solute:Na+ symporter
VIVTVAVSLITKPKDASELKGLVYGLAGIPASAEVPLYKRPGFWASVVAVALVVLNIMFW